MSEDLDWGPSRPPALSWAGALLLLLSLGQLAALATAVILDRGSLIGGEADRVVTLAAGGLFGIQLVVAVGVVRLWRASLSLGVLVSALGVSLHGVGLAPPPDPPAVVAVSAGLTAAHLIVIVLLVRGREAFR